MHRSPVVVLLLAVSLLAAPVSGFEIHTSHKSEVDFSALGSYAWEQRIEHGPSHPLAEGSPLDALLRAAGDRALEGAGFETAKRAEADFLVSYVGFVEDMLQIEGTRHELAEGIAWIGDPGSHSQLAYKEGTLVIEIRLPGSDDVVWSGWASDVARTPDRLRRKAEKAAYKILRHFPPQ